MKKFIFTLAMVITSMVSANAMTYEQARDQALFLTDKMAYELNLNEQQYDAAYEINLDYLMGVNTVDDVYAECWRQRNLDLQYIMLDWQYNAFCAASYFFRPLYWGGGVWHFGVYAHYPHHDFFYFDRPGCFVSYRGGHSWRFNGGHSWYVSHEVHYFERGGGQHFGMRDSWRGGSMGSRGVSMHGGNMGGRGSSMSGNMGGRGSSYRGNSTVNRGSAFSRGSYGNSNTSSTYSRSGSYGNSNSNYSQSRQSSTRTTMGNSQSRGSYSGGSSTSQSRGSYSGGSSMSQSRGSYSGGSTQSRGSYSGGSSMSRGSSPFGGGSSTTRGGSSMGGGMSHGGGAQGGGFGGGAHGGRR